MQKSSVPTITVKNLHQQFNDFLVIDVREPWEWESAHITGAKLIPLKSLASKISELDKAAKIAVLCHHGGRSAFAVAFLLQEGFREVYNVAGGIDAWSRSIDPLVPLY